MASKTPPPAGIPAALDELLVGRPDADELRAIIAGFDRSAAEKVLERATRVLGSRRHRAARQAAAADIDLRAAQLAAAGWVSLASVWPGAPCSPAMGVPARSRWQLDADGVWFEDHTDVRHFICSPVVQTMKRDGYAVRGKLPGWTTVPHPSLDRRLNAVTAGQEILRSLVTAGLRVGHTDAAAALDSSGLPVLVPAATMAVWFVCGISHTGDIAANIVQDFDGLRSVPEGWFDSAEERATLGRALADHPYIPESRGGRR